jgi:hypothetical protein
MAYTRPSQRDIAEAKKAARQEDMDAAIAQGRLVIRQMTPEEREQSNARRAAAELRNSARRKVARR